MTPSFLIRPVLVIAAAATLSACGMVAAGLGVTLVNELMARDYAHLPIVIRPIKERLDHSFAFAVSDEIPPTRTTSNFIEFAARRLEGMVGGS